MQGATYAVVNAQLPALMLLMLVALLTAGLFLATIRRSSWRLPLIASALWLVVLVAGGYLYPALVQSLVVNPNQQSRERPYIDRNVEATREALGIDIDDVGPHRGRRSARSTRPTVESDPAPLQDVRLLNPTEMLSRFQIDRGAEAGLTIDDLDVDRYVLDGRDAAGARRGPRARPRRHPEPELAGPPPHQHPRLRARDGAVVAGARVGPARRTTTPEGIDPARAVLQPEPQRVRRRRHVAERAACAGGSSDDVRGHGGRADVVVRAPGRVRPGVPRLQRARLGAIESDSQMLWVRNVRDRLVKLAPFLSFDGDPYPVVVDGRIKWVVDAYTSTSRYPYAQRSATTSS